MNIFGLSITKAPVAPVTMPIDDRRTWHGLGTIREPYAGAWQRNEEISITDALAYGPVYACVTLIANDIAKCRIKTIQRVGNPDDDIWVERENSAYSPVIRTPNHFQTRIEFIKTWMFSRLLHGNVYVLKERDLRGVVSALYVLDPSRVKVLVAQNGDVYYELKTDRLSQITEASITVPASEIIHDKMDAIHHPLVGISPLASCWAAILQALRIQNSSSIFFENGAQPGGILTTPNTITDEIAARLKERWEQNFSGSNAGRIAILGDGLTFEAMRQTAVESQLIEQLRWAAEAICTALHVPPFKIGVGPYPPYTSIEAIEIQYYMQALQGPIEAIEEHLDKGLSMPLDVGLEFNQDQLLRMDTIAKVTAARDAIGSAAFTINEARKKWFGLPPVAGGEVAYMQQQNWPLQDLASRDDLPERPVTPAAEPPPVDDSESDDEQMKSAELLISRRVATLSTRYASTEAVHVQP